MQSAIYKKWHTLKLLSKNCTKITKAKIKKESCEED